MSWRERSVKKDVGTAKRRTPAGYTFLPDTHSPSLLPEQQPTRIS
jgi:hypothetical protein